MDSLETPMPVPTNATSPAIASCCSTPTFPPSVSRSWVRDWRVLAGAGPVAGGSGLALGWPWLTAVGVAPLIVSAAPCLVMCALCGCMMGRSRQPNAIAPGTNIGQPFSPPDCERPSDGG